MAAMRSRDRLIMQIDTKNSYYDSPTTCPSENTKESIKKPLLGKFWQGFQNHLFSQKKGPAQGVDICPALKGLTP